MCHKVYNICVEEPMLLVQSGGGEDLLVLWGCDVVSHPRRADISFTPLRKYKNSLMGKYARNSRKIERISSPGKEQTKRL